jgi:predicted ABC-type ATPase
MLHGLLARPSSVKHTPRSCKHWLRCEVFDTLVLMPNVYVIAGPNGAGKTTFARDYLPLEVGCFEFINSDLIAAGLSPLRPEAAALRAGRIVLTELKRLASAKADFGFETTLAGKTYAKFLTNWKSKGYLIHLYYLWLPDVELHVQRVAERVRHGGHDVPEDDIRRRYRRSLTNLFKLYQPLADRWAFFDNTGTAPRLVATHNGVETEMLDPVWYAQMQKRVPDDAHPSNE